MIIPELIIALENMKIMLHDAITTRSYRNKRNISTLSSNGQLAKNNLIKSSSFIKHLHKVTIQSLNTQLLTCGYINTDYVLHPDIHLNTPELKIFGHIKNKNQDAVALFDPMQEQIFINSPMVGETDDVGQYATNRSIVIGIRSQLSSINKNFDTLMERTMAEAVNLRLRCPLLVMGEVYMIPIKEYDTEAAKMNIVAFHDVNKQLVEKYIKNFHEFSGRASLDSSEYYKYEKVALILVDFSQSPIKLYTTHAELIADNVIEATCPVSYDDISPLTFTEQLVLTRQIRNS